MYSIVFGSFGVTEAIISDQADICGKIGTVDTCKPGASRGAFGQDGNTVVLIIPGGTPGTFNVGRSGGDGGIGSFAGQLIFASYANGAATFTDQAVSGTITLDVLKAAESASGHYDVTMASGGHITGTFLVRYCAALGALGAGPSCNNPSTSTSTSCSNTCTCKGNSVSAACNVNDGGTGFDCTCTSSTGAQTTCSKITSVPASFACSQGVTCCPLAF